MTMVMKNHTKARLLEGETTAGCFLRYPVGTLAEFLALAGWDFLVMDAEHGTLQPGDVEDLSRACELHGVTPIVRVTNGEASTILRFLDAGAHGIQVPWVGTGEQAEAAVRAAKYQPLGQRGLAATRAARFGVPEPIGPYTQRANAETLVVVQVETSDGVANVEDLASVEGVDVVFIGPTDLAHSLGHVGNAAHPEVQAAMERVAGAVLEAGKALGIFVADAVEAVKWRARGARYLTTGVEPLLKGSMTAYLQKVRNEEGDSA